MSPVQSRRHLPKGLEGSLPTPHDMGCTTKLLGHAPGGPKIRLESGPTVARSTHKSPPARSHKSLIPDLSNASGRQLRHTKSYTLPHKKRETITDSISRSRSVTNNFPAEKGPTALLSSGGSPKRDRKLVCFFTGLICAVNSAQHGGASGGGRCEPVSR